MKKNPNYDPKIHHRKTIRKVGYDYSNTGAYFITICCHNRICRFGTIKNGEMKLNVFGKIAFEEWLKIKIRFPNIDLGAFQIMPNHIHGIILLNNTPVGAGFTPAHSILSGFTPAHSILSGFTPAYSPANDLIPAQNMDMAPTMNMAPARGAPTVGDVIGAYKSLVANGYLAYCKLNNQIMGKIWQRNFYEHIIRNDEAYKRISDYIMNNPAKWAEDKFYDPNT